MIIADGIGGQPAGALASALSVEAARLVLDSSLFGHRQSSDDVVALLIAATCAAQERVLQSSLSNKEWERMGSTLLLACVSGDELFVAHLGDVRCYVLDSSRLTQITEDHSLVSDLVKDGRLSPAEARFHPQKGVISRAIGMIHSADPDINQRTLKNGDRVLLCSDGLWESISDEEIRSVLRGEGSPRQLATVLVDRANAGGGKDNITGIVYQHTTDIDPGEGFSNAP
jgi:protein phosphatase